MANTSHNIHSIAFKELRNSYLGKSLVLRSKAIAAEFIFDLAGSGDVLEKNCDISSNAIFDAVCLSSSLTISVDGDTYQLQANRNGLDVHTLLGLLMDVQSTLEKSMIEAALKQSESNAKEYLLGARANDILDVCMTDVIGEYDVPDEVPEWAWIEKEACYAHCRNGQDGIWEFIINLNVVHKDIPVLLTEVFEQANITNMTYILFHQGT